MSGHTSNLGPSFCILQMAPRDATSQVTVAPSSGEERETTDVKTAKFRCRSDSERLHGDTGADNEQLCRNERGSWSKRRRGVCIARNNCERESDGALR